MAASDHRPNGAHDPEATSAVARSSAAPAGTHALVVHSDLRCPWARVAVHRLLTAAERRGIEDELCIDHRWFPLADDALPTSGTELDRTLAPMRDLAPDAGWASWADADTAFPSSSRRASSWVQAAKGQGPGASMALDRALRHALFAEGRPIDDEDVLEQVAGTIDGIDVQAVRSEVASGRPDSELDRHAAAARSDLVPASPTVVATDGTRWTNPGIEHHVEDGVPVVDRDDPRVHDEILDTFLARRHFD